VSQAFIKLAGIFLAVLAPAIAHAQDAKGCKDSPAMSRVPGSTILYCNHESFTGRDFNLDGGKQKHVEGEYTEIGYQQADSTADLQVFRNVESALKADGWTIDFERGTSEIVAHKDGTWFTLRPHSYHQSEYIFVTEKQMVQEVVANSAALSAGLSGKGHVVVRGIFFETGKADVKPESDPALKEVAKLLQQDAAMKVYVVGHTDNAGSLGENMVLSSRRASAVMKELTAKYGIAAARLQAFGNGPYAPVAANDNEEGRAQNRRVELVKQ
jgi:outer membrane protein OmpA-like peptidoglycan-associated protein